MTIRDKETRIADNIRLILKNSKTIKETQDKLKVNFISDDWRIIDLYSIDDYIRRIFGKTDNNRYSNIYNRYSFIAKNQNIDSWDISILLNYIAELIFINKDILSRWDSNIK